MKLAGSNIDRFVDKPAAGVNGFLIYGPNYGLGQEFITRLSRTLGGELTELRGSDLLENPARVHDMAYASSLFGGQNLIWLREVTDKATDALKELLGTPDDKRNSIIIEAGELTTKSRLRLLFEQQDHLAALPCYIEKGADLARTLNSLLKAENITLTAEARDYLVERAPADRLALRGEVERLVLFAGAGCTVDLDTARTCLGDAAEAEIFELPWLVFDGKTADTDRTLTRLFGEQTSGVAIIRSLISHSLKLHHVQAHCSGGTSASSAIESLRPPLFYNQKDRFAAQLGRWSLPRLTQAISRLQDTELKCKSTGFPEEPLVRQLTLLLAAA